MKINTDKQATYKEVIVEGRLDTKAVADFESDILKEFEDETTVFLMDCSKIEYISSSGLRVFLKIQKLTNAKNQKLLLHSMTDNIYEIFKMCNFTTIFTIVGDKAEAEKGL